MISLFQGETIYIEIDVKDNLGADVDITGSEAIFTFKKGKTVRVKKCTIEGNVIKVKLEPNDTKDLLNDYEYEVRIRDVSGDIDTILNGIMEVSASNTPVYPTI